MMEVELDGKTVSAMVYIVTPGHEFGIPSDYYADVIWQGYESTGFDTWILEEAIPHTYNLALHGRQEAELFQQSPFGMGGWASQSKSRIFSDAAYRLDN